MSVRRASSQELSVPVSRPPRPKKRDPGDPQLARAVDKIVDGLRKIGKRSRVSGRK